MIEWEVVGDHLRVVDTDNAELCVHGPDLDVVGAGSNVSRPVDATVDATASELRFPHAVVYAFSLGRDEGHELDPRGDPLTLPPGEYVVDIDTDIKTYLRFSGRATIEPTGDLTAVTVSFPQRQRVVLGFRSRHELPVGTITVPDFPDAFAEALTYLASSQKTDGPDRTYPSLRGHPPLFERGPDLEIPDHIRANTPATGIELTVPPTYEATFVAAPLAYYLQASVRTSDRDHPMLRVPDAGIEHQLSPMPELESDVERLLRKTFFLDSLVRNAGPYRTTLFETGLLDVLELDAAWLYEATPQERLAASLEVPYEAIEHRLPDWHLATYVKPAHSYVEAIPFLLDRLSMIYLPRTSELEGRELVERSLDDFYRDASGSDTNDDRGRRANSGHTPGKSVARASTGEVASVDIVKPELRNGRVHGWLANGVPIDVFKSDIRSYYNRLEYLEQSREATSICVVLNDPEMEGEHDDVADIYRQRSEDVAIDLTVEESLHTDDLASVFESPNDFVHYIGHCETEGLCCPDGYLSTSTLEESNTQTFFLNACGSFYEGITLLEKGSVAGAVTFTKVLNDHAIKVGSTFAKLLVHGFSIERAMGLARRRIMMGKDYAVVGDGTHTLTQGEHSVPTTVTLEDLDDGRYFLSLECYSTQRIGSYYFPHTEGNEYAYLCGNESNFIFDHEGIVSFLEETESPVIYDGDLYWSQDLWSELAKRG